jgi:endonuclease/exonuclease/phosphatase family metal-dependent hydrolase
VDEPDIGAPPEEVAATRDALAAAVGSVIPPKRSGQNLVIGTWNLRAFGDLTKDWTTPAGASPLRNFADIVYIATVIRSFDVVAVQEVHGNLRALRYLTKVLGDDWAFIMTDVTKGPSGNNERLAFLFDTTRVKPSGLACEIVIPEETDPATVKPGALNRQFARTPYAVSFISSGQTFILVTLHIDYASSPADRVPELQAIAEWLAGWAETEFSWDHNLIALGDFNIDRKDDPLYQAFTSTGLTPAPGLDGLPRTIFDKPTATHYYDQIAWFTANQKHRPILSLGFSKAGNFDFVPQSHGDMTLVQLSWHISDHRPLWTEFTVA